MGPLQIKPHHLSYIILFKNSISAKFSAKPFSSSANINGNCAASVILESTQKKARKPSCKKSGLRGSVGVIEAQLKENWLTSLSCPIPGNDERSSGDVPQSNVVPECVLGVDPDSFGALALLKCDDSGCSAQVFDSPHVKVLIGKHIRRRLDARSIVQLLQSLNVPLGTTAYVEQSLPYPQDGKQGWWSGGFGYGLWIGTLVASGFSVVPVLPRSWKDGFELSGTQSNKDDSRERASMMFPSLSPLFKRKKDHGRAEALLIAAYGKSLKTK